MKEANFPRSVKEVKFGAWTLNPKLQIITDGDVERELEPLLFKILSYLIINKDEIITRQDLIDDVWCQHYVDDNAINRAMSELRKVLKSEVQRGLVVKTHYRKGYSFFLEPEIVYHKGNADTVSEIEAVKYQSRRKILNVPVAIMIIVATSFYFFYSIFVDKDAFTDLKSAPGKTIVTNKKYNEETLSWMRGVYNQMMLSPDNSSVSISYIQKGQHYSSLLIKNLSTGQERKISDPNANIFPAGWSADSNRVIYRLQTQSKCELWDVGTDEFANSNYLFECQPSDPLMSTNIGLGNDTFIYAKYGYRQRSELSVLVNRNLSTGNEFQISSPNLNSYGDKYLFYIKSKGKIVFERRQFNSSELYMTDLEGGDQVKLYETKNRIWTVNYDANSDSLIWYDNVDKVLYDYSLRRNRIAGKVKVDSLSTYSLTFPISQNKILGLTYPFSHNVYKLDLSSAAFERVSSHRSKFSNFVDESIVFFSQSENENSLYTIDKNNKITSKPANLIYQGFLVSKNSKEALGFDQRKIEILDYKNLSMKHIIESTDNLISVEYLKENNIGYIAYGGSGNKSQSYIYNRSSSKSTLLPIKNAVWFAQLANNKFVFLNNLDELLFFDLSTGTQKKGGKINKSSYKNSFSIAGNKLFHSNGSRIYEYDYSKGIEVKPLEVYSIDNKKYFISNIQASNSGKELLLEVLELENNELVRLTLDK
ncbi:hypothetical protein PESP_a3875 [Pseudoalteromonas espejiana DSM 9414]|uniref:OmpR/PhoB-type domain-containing protein n=1 Tax=Pseudoalteromonas espejiana TaxID=28107 RepID=A0A510XYB7_9GAMM|nr:winged helix-turn-helix domain-containing protein [Pseudoalteromonas espejiana]ASM51622.1 hypothetical protein PESP_a3875 [Pseudoalteromonas espejiana DSM 9414]GEK56012.1 hypothetical protein PES01_28570 [Pseudoalteromonas espejiana]